MTYDQDDALYGEALRLHIFACDGCEWCRAPVTTAELAEINRAFRADQEANPDGWAE